MSAQVQTNVEINPSFLPLGLRAVVTSSYPLGACQVGVGMGIVAETRLEPSQFADVTIAFWKSLTPGPTSYYGKIRTEGQGMLTKAFLQSSKSLEKFQLKEYYQFLKERKQKRDSKGERIKRIRKKLQNLPHVRVNGVMKTSSRSYIFLGFFCERTFDKQSRRTPKDFCHVWRRRRR